MPAAIPHPSPQDEVKRPSIAWWEILVAIAILWFCFPGLTSFANHPRTPEAYGEVVGGYMASPGAPFLYLLFRIKFARVRSLLGCLAAVVAIGVVSALFIPLLLK